MPPAETIEEAFQDTSALPTSLLMGWLLASSLYKRDIDEERMKSKREQQELENEIQQLQEENQYVVAKCNEVAEQVITQCDEEKQEILTKCEEVAQQVTTQCDEEKQELLERLRQARNAGKNWTERVRDVVQDTQPPTKDETESYVMPKNDCSLDTFAATLASLTTEKQIKDYVNTFLIEFSMWCSGEGEIYAPGIKEIKRLEKARLMQIRP